MLSLLGDSTLYTVLPHAQHAQTLGIALPLVGTMLGINRLARILFNDPVGRIYTRVNRRPLMIGSLLLGSVSTWLYAAGGGVWTFLLGRILWGAAWSGLWIGANTMILDVSDDSNRGQLSGRFQMGFFIGIALSALLGGVFTDWLGVRAGLILSGAGTLAAALLWLFFLPETRPNTAVVLPEARDNPQVFPWREVLWVSVPVFAVRVTFMGVLAATSILWLELYLPAGMEWRGMILPLASLTGILVSVRTFSSLLGAPVIGIISDRVKNRWLIIMLMSVLCMLGLFMMGGNSFGVAATGMLIAAAAAGGISAIIPALIGDRDTGGMHSRSLGVVYTIGDVGSAIGPPLVLALLLRLPLPMIYQLCGLFFLPVIVAALIVLRSESASDDMHDKQIEQA